MRITRSGSQFKQGFLLQESILPNLLERKPREKYWLDLKKESICQIFQDFYRNYQSAYDPESLSIRALSSAKNQVSNTIMTQKNILNFKQILEKQYDHQQHSQHKENEAFQPFKKFTRKNQFMVNSENIPQKIIVYISIYKAQENLINVIFRGTSGEPIGYHQNITSEQKYEKIVRKITELKAPLIIFIFDQCQDRQIQLHEQTEMLKDFIWHGCQFYYRFKNNGQKKEKWGKIVDYLQRYKEATKHSSLQEIYYTILEDNTQFCRYSQLMKYPQSKKRINKLIEKFERIIEQDCLYLKEIQLVPSAHLACSFSLLALKHIFNFSPQMSIKKLEEIIAESLQQIYQRKNYVKQMVSRAFQQTIENHYPEIVIGLGQRCKKCMMDYQRAYKKTKNICGACSSHFGVLMYMCPECMGDFHEKYDFYEKRLGKFYKNKNIEGKFNFNKNVLLHKRIEEKNKEKQLRRRLSQNQSQLRKNSQQSSSQVSKQATLLQEAHQILSKIKNNIQGIFTQSRKDQKIDSNKNQLQKMSFKNTNLYQKCLISHMFRLITLYKQKFIKKVQASTGQKTYGGNNQIQYKEQTEKKFLQFFSQELGISQEQICMVVANLMLLFDKKDSFQREPAYLDNNDSKNMKNWQLQNFEQKQLKNFQAYKYQLQQQPKLLHYPQFFQYGVKNQPIMFPIQFLPKNFNQHPVDLFVKEEAVQFYEEHVEESNKGPSKNQ